MELTFIVQEEVEDGGFSTVAHIPDSKSRLITEGNTLSELYINIADVVEGWCAATKRDCPPRVKIILPTILSS